MMELELVVICLLVLVGVGLEVMWVVLDVLSLKLLSMVFFVVVVEVVLIVKRIVVMLVVLLMLNFKYVVGVVVLVVCMDGVMEVM